MHLLREEENNVRELGSRNGVADEELNESSGAEVEAKVKDLCAGGVCALVWRPKRPEAAA